MILRCLSLAQVNHVRCPLSVVRCPSLRMYGPLLSIALIFGCGTAEAPPDSSVAARTQLVVEEAKAAPQLAAIPPELVLAFELAHQISDEANVDYEQELHRLRGARVSGVARAFLARAPKEQHGVRQFLVHLLGEIGGKEDIPVLVDLAEAPLPERDLSRAEELSEAEEEDDSAHDHDESSELEGAAELQLGAVAALSRMTHRESRGAAQQALTRLVHLARRDVALGAAAELFDVGLLDAPTKKALARRGIPNQFKRVSLEEAFALRPDELGGTSSKSLSEPPVAQ